ncbi:MAG TPA: hypothetical protein VK590_08705 [Saprospiraceae bacterium]|nr:hypothetical protein [Saprospiraceae bacterium]
MNNRENLVGIIATLYRWRRQILTIVIGAAIISLVVSLFLPNYYSSTTSFYAASTDLAKPEMMYGLTDKAMEYYGGDADIDRLLTIAESNELKDFLVDSFKLFSHYEIDSSGIKSRVKVRDILDDLFEVKKTKYDAIEITIEDKDRFFAAKMTNAAREKINHFAIGLIKDNQKKILKSYDLGLFQKQKELNHLDDSLIQARNKYAIYNIEAQSELMGVMVARTENKLINSKGRLDIYNEMGSVNRDTLLNLKANIRGLENEMSNLTDANSPSKFTLNKFNNGLSKIEMLMQLHEQGRKRLGYDLERYNQLINAFEADVPSVVLIEAGQVPIVKSRPKRTFIIIGVTLAALLVSVIGILLIDNYSQINWKEELNAK